MYAAVVDLMFCKNSSLNWLNDLFYQIVHVSKLYMKLMKQARILDRWPFLFSCDTHEENSNEQRITGGNGSFSIYIISESIFGFAQEETPV